MALALQAPLHTLPFGAGLFAIVKAAFAALTREDLTPEQYAHAAQVREFIETFGGYILEAESREDLLVRVDAIIEDPAFHRAFNEAYDLQWAAADALRDVPTVSSPGEDYHAAFGQALGPAALPHLRELHRCMLSMVRSLRELQSQAAQPEHVSEEPSQLLAEESAAESVDPLFFLSDPAVPVAVARGVLGALRCCAFTIAAWAATVHTIEGWLGLAIAERWSEEAREMSAMFALLVEPDAVRKLDGRGKAIREAYARFNAEAERSGEPVYPSAS
ncbi:MAG TPA: hypothetical protein VK539_06405 [Myxococcaceae bacterium]|nr:hypothetical protein [Myxococcaceae bacterium]